MFSVPESIEIRAPADSANHSTGTSHPLGQVEGGDDAGALGLGHRAERLGRVADQDDPPDALRVQGVGVVTMPATIPALLCPGARSTGTSRRCRRGRTR